MLGIYINIILQTLKIFSLMLSKHHAMKMYVIVGV
jgi:hypothetical protein